MKNFKNEVLLTIRCITYNHEHFIRQCLDGFVMQKTNFRFEAIVHDDASTDGTATIIREYAEKYPDIIKPILETENQYSKHDGSLRRIMNEHTRGKYVAMCEGDDYWTDPYKLQKQVDFLESHPAYVVCTHHYQLFNQDSSLMGEINPVGFDLDYVYDLNYYVWCENWVTQPLTAVYRKSILDLIDYEKYKNSKDVTLFYLLLKKGKGMLMKDCMGVYRQHQGGVWIGAKLPERYHAEFITCLGIYDVEKDEFSARLVERRLQNMGYLGLNFMLKYFSTYRKVIAIIYKHFGLLHTIKLIVRSNNYFHSYFKY